MNKAHPLLPSERCIVLIGCRGAGKSTVGRGLAQQLGARHQDTDELIEQLAGKSIAQIFIEEGEPAFRRREREIISQCAARPPAILSVGGGAVLNEHQVADLRRAGVVVWLTAPPAVLRDRLNGDSATRHARPPLTEAGTLEELELILAQRTPFYEKAAHLVIATGGRSVDEIVEEILFRLPVGSPRTETEHLP